MSPLQWPTAVDPKVRPNRVQWLPTAFTPVSLHVRHFSTLIQLVFPFNPDYSVKQTSSGSETDLSSTENLTPEEHFVLKTGIRQEPQGEETYLDINATSDCLSFNNTLIIHENGALNNYNYMSPYLYGKLANNIYAEVIPKEQIPKSDSFYYHSHSISEQSTVSGFPNNDKPEMPNSNMASMIDNDSPYSNLNLIKFGQSNAPNNQLYFENQSVIKLPSTCQQNPIASNDGSISLQQPMLNNYLNSMKNDPLLIKSFNADKVPLPPPPPPVEYEKQLHAFQIGSNSSKSCERLAISRSHPDLSKFTDEELTFVSNLSYGYNQQSSPFYRNNAIEMLVTENAALRSQLELYINKVKRLQNVSPLSVFFVCLQESLLSQQRCFFSLNWKFRKFINLTKN